MHYGCREHLRIETACGKIDHGCSYFYEYGYVTMVEKDVTCPNCLDKIGVDNLKNR